MLETYESRTYSQNGEDGVIAELLARVPPQNKWAVEFGVGYQGVECNTRLLKEQGWNVLQMDVDGPWPEVVQAHVTAENIHGLLYRHGVPTSIDLLSIDVDGNDVWIWDTIGDRARVVVIEYNASVPPDQCRAVPYDPSFKWGGDDYYGSGLNFLAEVGDAMGYSLVHCDRYGVNAFFVKTHLLTWKPPALAEVYRPWLPGMGHPPSGREIPLVGAR